MKKLILFFCSFLILGSGLSFGQALYRTSVGEVSFFSKTPALDIRITASIGATLARPDEEMDDLMARADIAMYEAKEAGRNRVIPIR